MDHLVASACVPPHMAGIAFSILVLRRLPAIQADDDKIYCVYTTNSRTTIMLAVFEEAAITEYVN